MKKLLLLVAALLLINSPSYALFTNGGFESGDTTGWTTAGDYSVISSFANQWTPSGWTSGIPYYGSYSLLLGTPGLGNELDNYGWGDASQTDTITQADIDDGAHLYFRWGAILEEPTNYIHLDENQPLLDVEISTSADNGSTWASLYSVSHRANEAGFTNLGTNASGDAGDIWYGTDVADFDLSGLSA